MFTKFSICIAAIPGICAKISISVSIATIPGVCTKSSINITSLAVSTSTLPLPRRNPSNNVSTSKYSTHSQPWESHALVRVLTHLGLLDR
ncbi:hypothetical protein Hanom_Chr11g01022281 [Helianthus anomalus]